MTYLPANSSPQTAEREAKVTPQPASSGFAEPTRGLSGIRIHGLRVGFDARRAILDDLSLEVEHGEIVALVGASGCGKSTLLRAIAGLTPPQAGTIALDAAAQPGRSGRLAYVFQDATLLPWRTVGENVALPLELNGRANRQAGSESSPNREQSIREALAAVGLEEHDRHKFPRQLSGGMRMRTSIARALITDPDVLLLDEPFAALDDLLRSRLNDLLLQLWSLRRRTILFVTHNIAEAVYLSHRIVVLGGGRVAREIPNNLGWPRTGQQRSSLEFAALYGQVSETLAEVAGP